MPLPSPQGTRDPPVRRADVASNDGREPVSYQHFLITRMNTAAPFGPPGTCLDPEWLRHRFSLFETYTLPSVQAQVRADFEWLLFSHEQTPVEFRKRLEGYRRDVPCIRIIGCTAFDEHVAREQVLRLCRSDITHVITSRVDNDDAIGATFMAAVQGEFRAQDGEFINFEFGFQLHEHRVYRAGHPSNPYCSAIESRATFRGVYCVAHGDIARVYPVKQIRDRRRWLTVIHDRNALNHVDGERCGSDELREEFAFLDFKRFKDVALQVSVDRAGRRLRSAGKAVRARLRGLLGGKAPEA